MLVQQYTTALLVVALVATVHPQSGRGLGDFDRFADSFLGVDGFGSAEYQGNG